ncbi:MAG: molybdate ABC transporter substrate-binding protein, partial [Sphingobium sp.]
MIRHVVAPSVRNGLLLLLATLPGAGRTATNPGPPLVLAAASLQESLSAAADAWARTGHPRPILSFAGSSALARQIKAGAAADLFISADEEWMDDVEQARLLRAGTRADMAGNRLALVAPRNAGIRLKIGRGMPLIRAIGTGTLAMADPDSVPAGRYGKAALISLGVWRSVSGRIARTENVRAALALVERGASPLGIVYATDARVSKGARIVGVFPATSHPPIRYPLAL